MTISRKQQAIFPDLPRGKKVVEDNGELTPEWELFLNQLILALQTNIKPEGIVVPPQIASNILQLTGSASNNNILYDSTNNEFKGNVNGTWKTFTLT